MLSFGSLLILESVGARLNYRAGRPLRVSAQYAITLPASDENKARQKKSNARRRRRSLADQQSNCSLIEVEWHGPNTSQK
jgi:hypothetical protein